MKPWGGVVGALTLLASMLIVGALGGAAGVALVIAFARIGTS